MATKNKPASPFEPLLEDLLAITERIGAVDPFHDERAAKRARLAIDEATKRLGQLSANLDPVFRPASIFDPTAPGTAGRIVALSLVAQKRQSMRDIPNFYGAGVYAIYYNGGFEPYLPIAGKDHPIYVGKADPMDPAAKDAVAQGTRLSARLNEHAKNIGKATSTLRIEDFECRFLIVQTGFQTSAEGYLIDFFKPIWNSEQNICFGLGKHGDSSSTRGNKRSPWDTMHPGRAWAASSAQDQKTHELIIAQIGEHFERHQPYSDVHQIFDRFMSDMRQLPTGIFYNRSEVVSIDDAALSEPES